KKGDTLWDIAGVFLRDPWYWPEIWYVNPQVANPHLIYPGDVLNLVYVDGKPRITIGTAGAERLSPQVRSEPLSGAIRTIPYDLLMDFAGRPGLLTRDQARKAPYVVGMRDRHVVGSDQNEVYGRGLDQPAAGARYTIVNVGEELRDPDDGDLLGYIGHFAGIGEVIQNTGAVIPGESSVFRMRREEDLTHLRIVESGREVLQGDKLFPAQVDIGEDFRLAAPKNEELLGQVIAVVDGVYVAGKYQVVALNRGKQHGLEPGNVLGVFYRGEEVRDRYNRMDWTSFTANYSRVRLPDERSASVLVFSVHDRMSYALVVESSQVIRRGDFIAHPRYGHRDAGMRDFIR
ncbi:MAG TPA: LysM peptidoglycan-binding domain-containing protein, partial [Quisquiliibacterium sp.]|nr:LysM peptidoglycan-binding domain-containing protein [Quisquiliibacterium sp.]